MALVKVGKVYHIAYRDLKGVKRTKSTGETEEAKALIREANFLSELRFARRAKKHGQLDIIGDLRGACGFARAVYKTSSHSFNDAFEIYKQFVPTPKVANQEAWMRLSTWAASNGYKTVAEITPSVAYDYISENFGERKGKTWNNAVSCCNAVFKVLVIPCKLPGSPFSDIPRKPLSDTEHQRPFSDEEIARIIQAATLPWRTAVIIAYWTGFRRESAFKLSPAHISDGLITLMPGKTARYNRAVRLPVHPQLAAYLKTLPPREKDVAFCGEVPSKELDTYFGKLLDALNITDTEEGAAVFNSIRNNFISRVRAAKIMPDYALRGIVGHTSEEMTDLYSHEIESAMPLKDLPENVAISTLLK